MTQALRPQTRKRELAPPVSEYDHAQGPRTADITLVEYGDYHCPRCAAAQPWIKALQAEMGDRLRLVFRHAPAPGHPPHAAEAAEAAGRQGRFWEMHDTLFAHHAALGNGHLVEYARDLGLDIGQFLRDMAGHESAERVRSGLAGGAQDGAPGLPIFFVNGLRRVSPWGAGVVPRRAAAPTDVGVMGRSDDDGAGKESDEEGDES